MFGKKLLSIVGLLFAGKFVLATNDMAACGAAVVVGSADSCTAGTSVSASGYCISGTSIYVLNSATTVGCTLALTDNSVNIVKLDENNSSVIADITTEDIDDEGNSNTDSYKDKVAIVNCVGGTCEQTIGLIKDSTGYFTVDASNGATEITADNTSTDCAATGQVGKIITGTDTLCLNINSGKDTAKSVVVTTPGNYGNYIIEGEATSTGPDTYTYATASTALLQLASNATPNMVIKIGAGYIVKDNLYQVNDYCVNENLKIEERAENHCSSDSCDYYNCSSGTCTPIDIATECAAPTCIPSGSAAQQNACEEGYYLYNAGFVTEGNTGTLYKCDGTICKVVGTGAGETGYAIPTGYLLNQDSATGYIRCIGGTCTAKSVVTEDESGDPVTDCSSSGLTIGDLIEVGANTFICNALSATGGIEIAADDDRKIFVDVSATNAFGVSTNSQYPYVIAILNGGEAILNGKVSADRYKYTDKDDTTNEIQNRQASAICSANFGKIREFKKDDCAAPEVTVDYYKINSA